MSTLTLTPTPTQVSKSSSNGECGKQCALKVYTRNKDTKHTVSLRWKKTNKGGEININPINYNKTDEKALTFGPSDYVFSKPISLSFYKHIDLVINSKTPDCIATMHFESKTGKEELTVVIPFLTGDRVTRGTVILETIVDSIVNYQPNENDDPTHLDSTSLTHLFPEDGTYYEAPAKNEDNSRYVIVDTFQAIKASDMEKLQKLFDVKQESIADILRIQGKKLNFFSYYRSKEPIQEGMTSSSDDIYIDCSPVGADEDSEDTKEVTMKYDVSGSKRTTEGLFLALEVILIILCVMSLLFLINYIMKKYL
jgi:hypothetical protein